MKAVTCRLTAQSKGDRKRETNTNKTKLKRFFSVIFYGNFSNFLFESHSETYVFEQVFCDKSRGGHSVRALMVACALQRAQIINVTTENPLHHCCSTCCCVQKFTHNIPHRRAHHSALYTHTQMVFTSVVCKYLACARQQPVRMVEIFFDKTIFFFVLFIPLAESIQIVCESLFIY